MFSSNSALTLLINFGHLFSKYSFLYFHLTISGFNKCNDFELRCCIKMLKVMPLVASVSASVWAWLALISKIWSAKRWTAPLDNLRRILPVEKWMPLRSTWRELLMWRTQRLLMLQWPAFVHRGGGHCLGCAEQDRIGAGFCSWAGRCPACSHAGGVIKISVAVCFTPAPQKLSKLFSALRRILGAFRWFPEGKRA